MFLLILLFLFGSCTADGNSSDVHVDTSLNVSGSVHPPVETVNSTYLTYTFSVYFDNVPAGSALKITITTILNSTRVTVIQPVDGAYQYIIDNSLTVFLAGPAASVQLVLTRPDLKTGFGALVNWDVPPIVPTDTLTVALTVDRPSFIAYMGHLGRIGKGAVVVSTPPGSDLCISRPKTDYAFGSIIFVYSGDSIMENGYMGRLDKMLGCAGDRKTTLPQTFIIVSPYTVSIVDTPVFTLKSALTSYSLPSFSPQLLSGPLTVKIDQTPQTFLDSQPYYMSLLTTLTDFVFPDEVTSLQVWCGALYNNKSAEKYMIADISKSTLDDWTFGGSFGAFCRSLTLKTSKGTVSVKVGSVLNLKDQTRLVKDGSRGIITNFNYPFPEFSYKTIEMRVLKTENQDNMLFSLLFSEIGTKTGADSYNTDVLKNQNIQSVPSGEAMNMTGYQVQVQAGGNGIHYRMQYAVRPAHSAASAAALVLSLVAAVLLL